MARNNISGDVEDTSLQQEVKYVPDGRESIQLKPENMPIQKDTLFMYFTVISCQLGIFVAGGLAVWTSPTIPELMSNNTNINPLSEPITPVQISMLAGIPNFFSIVGSLLLPKFSDVIGRRGFMQLMAVLTFVSGGMMAFSRSVTLLIVARSICGMFTIAAYTVLGIYVTEISEDFQRAKFGCFMGIFHQMGHFYCYLIGPFFSVKILTLLLILPCILFVFVSFFIPESPTFYLLKNRQSECMNALSKLRSHKSAKELEMDMRKVMQTIQVRSEQKSLKLLFQTKEHKTGIMLGLLPCLVQQSTGIAAIMIYLAPIFNSAGGSVSGNHVAVVVSLVKISTFTFTSFTVERFGRRRMLLVSSVGTSMSLFVLGLYFFLKHIESLFLVHLQWLPLISVISVVSFYSLGLGPIPYGILNELFEPSYRAAASSFVMAVTLLAVTIVTSAYPLVAAALGPHWCIWIFSSISLMGTGLMFKYLPETKGMSLKEIQDMLSNY